MKRSILALLAASTAVVALLPAGATAGSMSSRNIVQIAASEPQFSTLVSLVKKAGLAGALEGRGPLTLFAPTNAAFAKVPAATLKTLSAPKNKAELIKVLEYHVVGGDYTAAKVEKHSSLTTLEGSKLSVKVSGGHVYLNNAEVTEANVMASNGVIHVINAVLIPKDL